MNALDPFIDLVRSIYGPEFVPLHRPVFEGRERQNLVDVIDSNFVSSVGQSVIDFEQAIAEFTGAKFAVATANGTAALHAALLVAGVQSGEEVLTQALTFVATCNAVSMVGAHPVFVDVDRDTMGLSSDAAKRFVEANYDLEGGKMINRSTGRRLAACLPMHTFGHPARIVELAELCATWNIPLIEDAAESLGSYIGEQHTGTFGALGVFSFNGNKVITTGGGGMIVTDDADLAKRAKHLTTTAKVPHPYEFVHDELGFNYRMPNLNAALGMAQMERLPEMLAAKKRVAEQYAAFFAKSPQQFIEAREGTQVNYWLNAICLGSSDERQTFLEYTNEQGVMTRPIWCLMNKLEMYRDCLCDDLSNSRWLEDRIVNIPSSVPDGTLEQWV